MPIDELPGYMPGTVLLYVFTMGAVVAPMLLRDGRRNHHKAS